MKIITLSLLIALFASGLNANAQEKQAKFTGTITYKITYEGAASNPRAASLPNSLTMKISGNRAAMTIDLPFGQNLFLINGDDFTVSRYIDTEQGKFFIRKTREDFKLDEAPMVSTSDKGKTIAGYRCKTAESLKMLRNQELKHSASFTTELGVANLYFNTDFRSVQGIMLEFDFSLMGLPAHLEATSVDPGRVSNREFEAPKGYTETTESKLREMRGPAKK